MTLLITAAEVLAMTGETVTTAQVLKAHFDIEIGCGRPFTDFEAGTLSDMDTAWLRRAVAAQASFIAAMPDKDNTVDAVSISETGGGATVNPDGLVIAPMARRALAFLSWTRSRTVSISNGSAAISAGRLQAALDSAEIDVPGVEWKAI